MGYAHYEITRNGETIEAGYGVQATCEQKDCEAQIDRGLGHLCGKDPGGDEHGCGGYFCGQHLTYTNQCQTCGEAADKANTWTNPETGEEFDLRDHYLPKGEPYRSDGWVWKHLGTFQNEVPVLVPVQLPDFRPGRHSGCAITEYEFENAALVAIRQSRATADAAQSS